MASTVRHRLNHQEINRILNSTDGPVARTLLVRAHRVQSAAKRNLGGGTLSGPKRIDTGRLRASIDVELIKRVKLAARIGTNVEYALFVHEGTGIYGPKHTPITPKTSRYLQFKPRGSSDFVYAKSVKGMKANPFLVNALPAANLKSTV